MSNKSELKNVKAFIRIDEELCKGCALCVEFCPKKLIRLSTEKINAKGYYPAEFIDEDGACTGCSICGIMCPDVAIVVNKMVKDNKKEE